MITALPEATLELIGRLAIELMDRGLYLGTAESCTGGLIAASCTEIPGSSAWFAGGVVSYADAVKQRLLHVSEALLREHGAVSEAVVRAMAQGGLSALPVDVCLAVSGVAGPGGGSEHKPVGTVWMAVARKVDSGCLVSSQRYLFPGIRADIRQHTVQQGLRAVLDLLMSEQGRPADVV